MRTAHAFALIGSLLVIAGCNQPPEPIAAPPAVERPTPPAPQTATAPAADAWYLDPSMTFTTSETGLQYAVTKQGSGATAQAGKRVYVHYTGQLAADKTQFDSSLDRGTPIDFVLGTQAVIPGWDEGIEGMKIGEKRRLVVPPDLGYGPQGFPGAIPPNATLVFDVELISVE